MAAGLVVGPVSELPVLLSEHLQLRPALTRPHLPGADDQDEGADGERGKEAGVLRAGAYGETPAVGEPDDRPVIAVAFDRGDASVDSDRVSRLPSWWRGVRTV